MRASVAARLGYDPFIAEADRTIVASITEDRGRLAAVVRLVDRGGASHGKRELSAPAERCDELVRAMALSISIAIDPERAEASLATDAPSPELPPVDADPAPGAEKRARAIPPPETSSADVMRDPGVAESHTQRARFGLFSGAGAHAAVGTAPSGTGGVFVFAGMQVNAFSIALEGRADAPGADTLDDGATVSSTLFAATLLPCLHGEALFACASGTAGVIRASAEGVSDPRRDDGLYAAAGARGGAEMQLSADLRLRLHLDLWLSLTRVEVALDQTPVWRAPPFAGTTGLGLMARFW